MNVNVHRGQESLNGRNAAAKKRGIIQNVLFAVRTVMIAEVIDLVACDFEQC